MSGSAQRSHSLLDSLKKINLFESYSEDAEKVNAERISTRFYIVLMLLSMSGILIYALTTIRTTTVNIKQPTVETFSLLYEKYSATLACPCSQVATRLNEFSGVDVQYHEVCSSPFIEQTWIDAVYHSHITNIPPDDIRVIISHFWQFIRSLCTLSSETFIEAYTSFNGTLLLSSTVHSRSFLSTKVSAAFNTSFTSAIANLQRNLFISRETSLANGFISIRGTNFILSVDSELDYSSSIVKFKDGCSCTKLTGCPRSIKIYDEYNRNPPINIMGMIFDCLITDGVFASSLECFYRSDCISVLESHNIIPMNTQPLQRTSRFSQQNSIRNIFSQAMIEELTPKINFDMYYSRCNPTSCTYTYTRRFDPIFTLTTMISAFGGISILLRLLCPYLTSFLNKLSKPRNESRPVIAKEDDQRKRTLRIKLSSKMQTSARKAQDTVVSLNLFKTTTQNQDVIRRQKLTTWFFIIVMICLLVGFTLYWLLLPNTKTIRIENPTYEDYEKLRKTYENSLQCPCSQISIPYSNFIRLVPRFHQVCSSQMVDPEWYDQLNKINFSSITFLDDFRRSLGSDFFRATHIFCSMAKAFLNDAYEIFKSESFINSYILSRQSFEQKITSVIDNFKRSTTLKFSGIIDFTGTMTYISQLGSQKFTNMRMSMKDGLVTFVDTDFIYLDLSAERRIASLINSNDLYESNTSFKVTRRVRREKATTTFPIPPVGMCSCTSFGPRCGFYASFSLIGYNDPIQINRFLVTRCLLTDSVITSSLECWYSQTCTNLINSAYIQSGISYLFNNSFLDLNVTSRFTPQTFMSNILKELLIENWTDQVSYEAFFSGCAPSHCSYTIQQRFDWLFVGLNLFSVAGGLNKGLKILLPPLVLLLVLTKKRYRTKTIVQPFNSTNTDPPQLNNAIAARTSLKEKILNQNLFETPRSTEATRPKELLSTRVYIILLTVSIVLLIVYGGASERTIEVKVTIQSQTDYEVLYGQNQDTLSCPCTTSTIFFETFFNQIEVLLHPICSHKSIDQKWIGGFARSLSYLRRDFPAGDFRSWGAVYFQIFSSLCTMANSKIQESIKEFKRKSFVSTQVIPMDAFQFQNQESFEIFKKTTEIEFTQLLQAFRATTQANNFLSLMNLNANGYYDPNRISSKILLDPRLYENGTCSCATSSRCLTPVFFGNRGDGLTYYIDGLYSGCYLSESVLRSSLQCFFSNSCMVHFTKGYMNDLPWFRDSDQPSSISMPLLPLLTLPNDSRFLFNDTIEALTKTLLVDKWSKRISYPQYFNVCAPTVCTYTYIKRWDPVFILTTFLGIYQGMSTALRILVPILVKFFYRVCYFMEGR